MQQLSNTSSLIEPVVGESGASDVSSTAPPEMASLEQGQDTPIDQQQQQQQQEGDQQEGDQQGEEQGHQGGEEVEGEEKTAEAVGEDTTPPEQDPE